MSDNLFLPLDAYLCSYVISFLPAMQRRLLNREQRDKVGSYYLLSYLRLLVDWGSNTPILYGQIDWALKNDPVNTEWEDLKDRNPGIDPDKLCPKYCNLYGIGTNLAFIHSVLGIRLNRKRKRWIGERRHLLEFILSSKRTKTKIDVRDPHQLADLQRWSELFGLHHFLFLRRYTKNSRSCRFCGTHKYREHQREPCRWCLWIPNRGKRYFYLREFVISKR